MKLIIKIFLVTSLLLSVTSCEFLDQVPDEELTIEMVFNDKTLTEEWLAGVYSSIPDPYWGYARSLGFDCLSDDMSPSEGWIIFQPSWTVIKMMKGDWSPRTEWQGYYWSDLPKRIRAGYVFLENVKPIGGLSTDDVETMKYEVRFLIAYYYSLLLDVYGPYPFAPGLVSSEASAEELQLPQTPFDEIVNWVDKELADVAKKLPAVRKHNSEFGRATSVMCHAVRARMLLFVASPLVNGNPDFAGHKNSEGTDLFNTTYDSSKWERAAKACRDLIDLAHSNGHSLYKEYNTDGTIDPFVSYHNMMFKRWDNGNKEILFARPECYDIFDYDKHCSPKGSGGNGGLGITQSLVDAFFMENGYPITDEENSGYVENGFSTSSETRNTRWTEGSPSSTPGEITVKNTYNMYCHREPRFYVSVLYNGAWYRPDNRKIDFRMNEKDGGPGYDAPQNGYLNRKKVHPDHHSINKINPYRPGILYRLGEAYLNYVEAALECADRGISNEYLGNAMDYWDAIRERAGLPAIKECYPNADIKTLIQLLRQERRVELNSEGIRFRDLRRWNIGVETLNTKYEGMNFEGTKYSDDESDQDAFFKRTPYFDRTFKKQYNFFPVPSWEMDKNPALVQNPFW